jgi:hypothetical protein
MAVVNVLSPLITNRDATPRTINPVTTDGARMRTKVARVEVTNGDSIASTFRLFSIPSNARVHGLKLFCDAITSAAADVGLYQTTANGGAVVDADAYASAQTIATANKLGIEVAFEQRDIDKAEQRVWQDAALTADPTREYDIVATLTAAATATGTLVAMLEYAVD